MTALAEEGAFFASTSGTTGVSTNLVFSERDRAVRTEVVCRNFTQIGLRPGDALFDWFPVHAMGNNAVLGASREVGLMRAKAAHSPVHVDRFEHALEYLEPDAVVALSPALVEPIRDHIAETDRDPREFFEPVESVVWMGGPLIDDVRDELEREWGVEVFEWVGSDEPGWMPCDCAERKGWGHVPDDHFYVEVIDSETGEPVEEGERGELVLTPLSYTGMSHVRWAHDDIVEWERGTCECGRTGTRINFVGRVGDLVRVDGKKLLPWDVLPVVNRFEEMPSRYFQFYADSEEALRIRLAYAEEKTDDVAALVADAGDAIEEAVGVPVEVVETMTEAEMGQLGPGHKIPRIVDSG
jgi:phenylacetate-CoA ligase